MHILIWHQNHHLSSLPSSLISELPSAPCSGHKPGSCTLARQLGPGCKACESAAPSDAQRMPALPLPCRLADFTRPFMAQPHSLLVLIPMSQVWHRLPGSLPDHSSLTLPAPHGALGTHCQAMQKGNLLSAWKPLSAQSTSELNRVTDSLLLLPRLSFCHQPLATWQRGQRSS